MKKKKKKMKDWKEKMEKMEKGVVRLLIAFWYTLPLLSIAEPVVRAACLSYSLSELLFQIYFLLYFLPDNPLISLIYLFSILYCIHYNSHLPNASCAWSIKCKCLNRWWSRKSSRLQTSSGFPRLTQDQPSSQRPRLCHSRIRMHQSITNI